MNEEYVSEPIVVAVDGVNVSRGADQTIVYTASFGASTATNEYGYEVVAEDGCITQLGGNNAVIPSNGFVVSFHGETMKRMRACVTKAMSVRYDEASQTVTFGYSTAGLRRAVAYAVDRAQQHIDEAKAAFVLADYASAQARLAAIEQERGVWLSDSASPADDDLVNRCVTLIDRAEAVCRTLCDSVPVHYRGVWIRPSQANAAEVEAYVKALHDAHINFVCVEGWFANGMIMTLPEDSLFAPHPHFDYDVLQAYVDACHKHGMECHLWMPILNVGSFYDDGHEYTLAGRKPEWMSQSNHGARENPNGFMMLDPSNADVRRYLVDFYRYIVTTYAIDGFEMDYVRYYAASAEDDYGYTPSAFAGFEEAYGYGVTPQYDPEAAYWDDWCRYRRDCITELVRSIRAMIDQEAPHVLLAADVAFPFSHALNAVYQNFPQWLEEGLLDILHPMAYGDGYGEDICKAVALAGNRCMVVTGLGAQGDLLRVEELERQARENADYGARGECYFEAAAYFYKHIPQAVEETVYRRAAITPFSDDVESVCAALAYMVERVDTMVHPLGGLNDSETAALKAAIERVVNGVRERRLPSAELADLHRAIADVSNTKAVRVLENDLYRVEHILCVKHRLSTMPW